MIKNKKEKYWNVENDNLKRKKNDHYEILEKDNEIYSKK